MRGLTVKSSPEEEVREAVWARERFEALTLLLLVKLFKGLMQKGVNFEGSDGLKLKRF